MNKTMAYKIIPFAMLCLSINVSAANVEVGTREYKILLNPSLFTGHESVRMSKINDYWKVLKNLIEKGALKSKASGRLNLEKSRTVSFYDVKGSCDLLNAGYSFRERIEDSKRKVTLKFRSSDQLLASIQDLSGTKPKAKSKFEEDVAVPFISTYSSSTTQKIGKGKKLNKMDDPVRLYPGLKNKLFDENLAIEKVSGLTVSEYVYKNTAVKIGSIDEIAALNAEFTLTLWYNELVSKTQAIVAEISFKYKTDNEHFNSKVDTRAKVLFTMMQEHPQLANWSSINSQSKTAVIYQYDRHFCH
ncbi:hypothetical protein [Psychromonas sp. SP041]|uniref:hypothetical protein n=1 Tax=Psychromonas sp. SP041 TaxID=1365007 RepID=UPI0003F715BE|nr:hypothetical protein [Psychromonas sp. SP041]